MAIIRADAARRDTGSPDAVAALGQYEDILYSQTGGLTRFGAFVEVLQPGARSSDRHWHEAEDEFLYMLEGRATIVENGGPVEIGPGDACCWPAGVPDGHQVINLSDAPCRYLIVGSRAAADVVHYSDVDRIYRRAADGTETRTRRDGSPLEAI